MALVALLLVGLLSFGGSRIAGATLARSIAAKLICAAQLSGCKHSADSDLVAAYGESTAMLVRRFAPNLRYEDGMVALPVDFRHCRSTRCGDGAPSGVVWRSLSGEPVTAFTHVVDCRGHGSYVVRLGIDCTGDRAGNLYIQYWLYYADSASLRGVPIAGAKGYHADDWEGQQIRIRANGSVDARSSSHHGYNGAAGPTTWVSDVGHGSDLDAAGLRNSGAWIHSHGKNYISGGSHAGHAYEKHRSPFGRQPPSQRGLTGGSAGSLSAKVSRKASQRFRWHGRSTPGGLIHLVPIEPISRTYRGGFAISAPWNKLVYRDPEDPGTS